MLKYCVRSLLIFCFSTLACAGTPISICTDTNFWYPFTFVKDKQAAGLHIDIITAALRNLNYEPTYKPMPWSQCQSETKAGHFDALATIAYNPSRADYLYFPSAATESGVSPLRVTQVEYLVITSAQDSKGEKNTYSFRGDLKTIPNPVRVPMGYSIIENLEREGLQIQEGKTSIDNFIKLKETQTGSVIDLEDVTKHLATQPEFSDQFVISSDPIFSRSYFLAMSKKGKITPEAAEKIWKEIAKVREDKEQMAQFLNRY